ncbi:peptidase S8 [bacterium]|nr:peptidase S8 [bacterium]
MKKDLNFRLIVIIFITILSETLCFSFHVGIASAFSVLPLRTSPHPLYAPQEVLIRFVSWASSSEIQNILDLFVVKNMRKLHKDNPIFKIELALPVQVEEAAALLKSFPLVIYAEPNYYVEAEFIPNDPIYIYQWHMGMINMEAAWDVHNGSGAIVSILDTGIAYRNVFPYAKAPDLAGTSILPGWDFVNDDPYPDDDHGHGTHIVGTIAQTTNNLLGCAGIAYGCSILPVKVLDENSNGLLDDVVSGIYFAVDNGAHVINTSFGTVTPSQTLEDAVDYAALNGVTIVCSAGNGASTAPHYPSSYPACISVSAVKYDKTLAFYSNYGTDIDLCAPGGSLAYDQNLDGKPDGIVQQTHDGIDYQTFNYFIFQGTSCAAAHVTGVAALIIGASGGALKADQVKSILEATAQDLGGIGWDQYFGWGLVDAAAALKSLPVIATVSSVTALQPVPNILPSIDPYITFGIETALASPVPYMITPSFGGPPQWTYYQNTYFRGMPAITGYPYPFPVIYTDQRYVSPWLSQVSFSGIPNNFVPQTYPVMLAWQSFIPSFPSWGTNWRYSALYR